MMLGWLICRFKGHRWGHAKKSVAYPSSQLRYKICGRCGTEREVKTRAKKS